MAVDGVGHDQTYNAHLGKKNPEHCYIGASLFLMNNHRFVPLPF